MNNYYDLIVVGAGPAGSVAARTAAEQGISVLILEKDEEVGYPVRCGEAISKGGVEEFINPDKKWIASTISRFSFNAPDGTEVIIEINEAGYVLDRKIFDYELSRSAVKAGAEVKTGAYVNGLLFKDGKVAGIKCESDGKHREIMAKVVIAADGVESRVGRWAGLKTHIDLRDMESAVQITAENIPVNQDTLYFYFGKNYAPNGYFWIFPKGNNKANIGLGVSGIIGKKKSAQTFLNEFMDKNYPESPVLNKIAGGIPCSVTLPKISAPGIMLAGDAARQVNPLSGGGIASGMIGGNIAGKIAAISIMENKPDHLLSYDKAWAKRLGKRHEIFNRIKNGIYDFSDEKFNSIAHSFSKVPFEKRTLKKLFTMALVNNPSLIYDVAKVFVEKQHNPKMF